MIENKKFSFSCLLCPECNDDHHFDDDGCEKGNVWVCVIFSHEGRAGQGV